MSLSSVRRATKEDPWPLMERQVEQMMTDLLVHVQRFRDMPHPTVIAENELIDVVTAGREAVEDMRFALDTAMEHPESFSISSDELQQRAEKTRQWERDMDKAVALVDKVKKEQRQRASSAAAHAASMDDPLQRAIEHRMLENNDFLKQEHDVQRDIALEDDLAVDRLSMGIKRVKSTAVNIHDELHTQEVMLNDLDRDMSALQVKLEGVIKRVGRLLDQASDRNKFICIGVLLLILVLLIVFVVK